jgi:peptidoglycan/xylan/chitin deacetylase (PgdA/CDA1 family)
MNARAVVFCFHDIVEPEALDDVPVTHRPYSLTPEEFRLLLLAAQQSGRRGLPVGQVPGELSGGFYSLTFDDGSASDYTKAFPILVELGLRATFFIVPSLVDTPGFVSWGQLREMVAAGMEIGSHSMTHPFLNQCSPDQIRHEYAESKRVLEDRLGRAVRSASLPRGWEPPGVGEILQDLGYRVFCTSRVGWWYPGGRALQMPRVPVQRQMTPDEFATIAQGEPRALWRLQAVDGAKNLVKSWVGTGGWQRLRAPLLALRYRLEGPPR